MVNAETLLPGRAVVVAVHDLRAGGPAVRDRIVVLVAPVSKDLMFAGGCDTKVFVIRNGMYAHAENQATGEAQDDDDRVGGRITEEIFLEAAVLVAFLFLALSLKKAR